MTETHVAKTATLKKTVALVGMMGAGKTAVGRAVAAKLGVPFLDSDHEIEQAANMSVAEVFEKFGEPFFRDKESRVIARLLDGAPCVLSTGGGAFMADRNRSMITERGVSVWLNADLELLWSRVRHKDTRPLLRGPDPLGTLTELYHKRVPIYARADLTVAAAPELSIDQMAQRVIGCLAQRADVLEMTDG